MEVHYFDMDGKEIEDGHIVAMRYIWNSYVAVARPHGLFNEGALRHASLSPHRYKSTTTYQIIGHMDNTHKDFNQEVYDWYKSEDMNCPVEVKVYNNLK